MGKTKRGTSKFARIWDSLWNNQNDPNEIDDPDTKNPAVEMFNVTVDQQKEYYKKLQVKARERNKENKEKSKNESGKSELTKKNKSNISIER